MGNSRFPTEEELEESYGILAQLSVVTPISKRKPFLLATAEKPK